MSTNMPLPGLAKTARPAGSVDRDRSAGREAQLAEACLADGGAEFGIGAAPAGFPFIVHGEHLAERQNDHAVGVAGSGNDLADLAEDLPPALPATINWAMFVKAAIAAAASVVGAAAAALGQRGRQQVPDLVWVVAVQTGEIDQCCPIGSHSLSRYSRFSWRATSTV